MRCGCGTSRILGRTVLDVPMASHKVEAEVFRLVRETNERGTSVIRV